jgi:sugar fermentation stimulation protein A
MRFQTPLVPGRLIRRYKRFLADVLLDTGVQITAHCPNPGAMLGLAEPGMRVWLEPNDDPKRKLKYGWRLSHLSGDVWVGIDTGVPNKVIKKALLARTVPELAAYGSVRPEVKYAEKSRIDFLLVEPGLPDAYVEVKNVHLCRTAGLAEFPDSVTQRGARHLEDLAGVKAAGHRAVMLYLVQRTDCSRFSVAGDLDPAYGRGFGTAQAAGVEMLCYDTRIDVHGVTFGQAVDIELVPQI